MTLFPADITIAVTVYDRREFIQQAVLSALNQTVPVKVIVVEDCGPDTGLQGFVCDRFGPRITYRRNPRRRGLFDNWNACIEYCATPWLSILHDDDYLKENFAETMLNLHTAAPGRGLYFGNYVALNSNGETLYLGEPVGNGTWRNIDLRALADSNRLGFGGHLFPVEYVRRLGGFRSTSLFCGDWEMWFKLSADFGGAFATTPVVVSRLYQDQRKGTSKVVRKGLNHAANIVQRKRNYAWLKRAGVINQVKFDDLRRFNSIGPRDILIHGTGFSRRMFRYNVKLFLTSLPASPAQRALQWMCKVGGVGLMRVLSEVFSFLKSKPHRLGSSLPPGPNVESIREPLV
jgi:glycosyltransferase involved in cell wall biosynthesis